MFEEAVDGGGGGGGGDATIPEHVLVYCGISHPCCPKFRAGVPCTILSVLVYHVLSQITS